MLQTLVMLAAFLNVPPRVHSVEFFFVMNTYLSIDPLSFPKKYRPIY